MGRVKLMIKRLESISNRKVTYTKRRSGILKKAKELSILCDIDILLLMFSPSGRPTILHGDHRCIGDVIAKFAQLTPQERTKRKLESLEALKKTFMKLDHDVKIHDFLGERNQTIEIPSPLLIKDIQENHSLSWLPGNNNQQVIIPGDSSFLPHREMADRTVASLPVYSSIFESGNQEDQICNLEQQFDLLRQEGSLLNELNGNSSSSLQLGERYSYPTQFGMQGEEEFEPSFELNVQQHPTMYPVSNSVHFPDHLACAANDRHHQNWISDSTYCNNSAFRHSDDNQICSEIKCLSTELKSTNYS